MHTPPNPGIPPFLLDIARILGLLDAGGGAGTLEKHVLTVESAGGDRAAWALLDGDAAPTNLAPRLLTKTAYTALREGQLDKSGALVVGAKRYALSDVWDGQRLVATLVELVAAS